MSSLERRAVSYPESDGAPVGETAIHGNAIARLYYVLTKHFHDVPDVYVGYNNFIYYAEGRPEEVVIPDIYVAFGTGKHPRNVWKVWEEGMFPQVTFEMISPSSRVRDIGEKRGLCGELGVEEYWVYDPLHEVKPPYLRGWRRQNGVLVAIEPTTTSPVTLRSERLGFLLQEDGMRLRLLDGRTGQPVPHWEEEWERLNAAERESARVKAESERVLRESERVRQENERLAEEIRRLRARKTGD